MRNIFRSLSFNITQAVYTIIPDLYGVFMDLASNRYFSEKSIKELSTNIYTVISVCMLFALGIKLLSAIVNPDLLDDKKKGAKKVFINCALSVFLIILIPIGFEKLYELQKDVVKNQLVEKLVLGMDTSEQSDPGQILAAYAFSSFCHPKDIVSSEKIANSGGNLYNKALQENINLIYKLDDVINSKTNGDYDLEYNTLISPIVGVVLDYQLILLCMDTALRTIKLGLLELIAPIVLCGFIFAGSDLLQRWFKEVISTFTLLFIKIGTVSFLIFGLSLLPGFLKNFSDKTTFYKGFLRVFMLIGLLQVIHILPDIIKKIFNVDVKLRGGIRGRLGEMAGVGKLAQNAWDKIKTAGLKIGAVGAAAVGLGAIGTGLAATGALAGRHLWKKGWQSGFHVDPIKNTKFGKGLKTFGNGLGVAGAGAAGIWAGLSAKGGIKKSIAAGTKKFEENEIGKQALTDYRQAKANKRAAEWRERVNAEAVANGINGGIFDKNGNYIAEKADNMKARKVLENVINSDSALTKQQKEDAISYFRENMKLSTLNELKGQKEKMVAEIDASINNLDKTNPLYNSQLTNLTNLKDSVMNGKATSDQIDANIRSLVADGTLTKLSGSNLGTSLAKIMNALDNTEYSSKFIESDGRLNLSNGKLLGIISDQKNAVDAAKADYDEVKGAAAKEAKELLGRYERNSGIINNKAMFAEQDGIYNNYKNGFDNIVVAPQPTPNTGASGVGGVGGAGSSGSGSQTINGATINVTNLNADNINAQNINGNMNSNRFDTSSLKGDPTSLDDDTMESIKDAIRRGVNESDLQAAVEDVSKTVEENYQNQNVDDTYRNGGFDTNRHDSTYDDNHNEFDQFYDDDNE